jgi:hypothetical protein
MKMNFCRFGCGLEGKIPYAGFYSKGLFRCAKSPSQCPARKHLVSAASKKAQLKIDQGARAARRNETMARTDENGINGFTRNARAIAAARRKTDGTFTGADKTTATKRNTIDKNGRDLFDVAAINTAITRFGRCALLAGMPEFERYRRKVMKITNQQSLKTLQNYDKRAAYGKSDDPHQLDHRFSIIQGFLQQVSPEIIGHIANLEMLPSRQNNSKGSNCSITLEALLIAVAESSQ